jgi:hypothetical protein
MSLAELVIVSVKVEGRSNSEVARDYASRGTYTGGVITIRYDSRLRHTGLGREHHRNRLLALIADRYIRVIDAESGHLLRELTLDPNRDYQPLGRPPGPHPRTPGSVSGRSATLWLLNALLHWLCLGLVHRQWPSPGLRPSRSFCERLRSAERSTSSSCLAIISWSTPEYVCLAERRRLRPASVRTA